MKLKRPRDRQKDKWSPIKSNVLSENISFVYVPFHCRADFSLLEYDRLVAFVKTETKPKLNDKTLDSARSPKSLATFIKDV